MKRRLPGLLALAGLALALAGCGSRLGGCGMAPCGGDPVGTWAASSACLDHATLEKDFLAGVRVACPTASLGAVSMKPTGTLALGADKSFTGDLAVSSEMDVNYPATCTNGASCAELTEVLQTIVGTNGITSVTCTGTSSCVCTHLQSIDIIRATGTWATSGTNMTFAGAPGGNGPYCVQGASLHLLGYDLATMTTIVSDFVLTKP